jgi:hypothetical protein
MTIPNRLGTSLLYPVPGWIGTSASVGSLTQPYHDTTNIASSITALVSAAAATGPPGSAGALIPSRYQAKCHGGSRLGPRGRYVSFDRRQADRSAPAPVAAVGGADCPSCGLPA